jgi:hypothetical protein
MLTIYLLSKVCTYRLYEDASLVVKAESVTLNQHFLSHFVHYNTKLYHLNVQHEV